MYLYLYLRYISKVSSPTLFKTGFPKLGSQSNLVVGCERVDDDGDGKGEDEDAGDGGEAADELAEVRPGVKVVADGGDGHQAPPERLHERPREVGVAAVLLVLWM